VIHSLPSGYSFDLRARVVLEAGDHAADRKAREAVRPIRGKLREMARQLGAEGADSRAPERRRRREEREASS
jgi:hypothetical protein